MPKAGRAPGEASAATERDGGHGWSPPFIDSQGIRALVEAYKANQPSQADRMIIRSPRPQARKVLELTGLEGVLRIED